ncbi:MAG: hypothetical protein HQL22_09470 [Candidatus Omnitrophica bacterium]|nr:hypothetical protein [Candidatus Omnitrophota bacterium]
MGVPLASLERGKTEAEKMFTERQSGVVAKSLILALKQYMADRVPRPARQRAFLQEWQTYKGSIKRTLDNFDAAQLISKDRDQAVIPNHSRDDLGGIDLTADKTSLEIQNTGAAIKFYIDPAMLQQLQSATGFTPVIIDIQPTTSIPQFLGMKNGVAGVAQNI